MKTKILMPLIVLAVFISSCNNGKEYDRYELTDMEKQLIPYQLGDVIGFIDSEGQTFTFTIVSDKTYWWYDNFGQHPLDYISINTRAVLLKSDNSNILLWIDGNEKESLHNNIHIQLPRFSARIVYDKGGDFLTLTDDSYSTQYFHAELEINNKVYYNVVEYISEPYRILYNKTYGILQMEDENKILFYDKLLN